MSHLEIFSEPDSVSKVEARHNSNLTFNNLSNLTGGTKIMSKTQKAVTINNISTLVSTPEQYVTILINGTLRSKVDKSVCKTLYQLAGDFLMEQRVKDSAYFYTDPSLDTIENQKEIQARLRDLQYILTNRAVAIFYLNMQNNYDFGAFSDIEQNLYEISKRDYWFILQEPEWKLVLSSMQSATISPYTKESMRKILEAFSLHLYAYLVKKDSMYKEHTSIGRDFQISEDMSQMGYEALLKYLENFDTSKPGNPYMNSHVIKNEINSKLNDYGRENRNDRTRRANWSTPEKIDYKTELLRTYSINEFIQQDDKSDETVTSYEAILMDESSSDSFDEVEVLDNFKKLYLSLESPIERSVLYRCYFEQDAWTQTTLAKDLHISPLKLKRIRAIIQKNAEELGIILGR